MMCSILAGTKWWPLGVWMGVVITAASVFGVIQLIRSLSLRAPRACPKCCKHNQKQAVFCTFCGAPLADDG